MTGLVVHRTPRGKGLKSRAAKERKQLLGRVQAEAREQRLEARRPTASSAPTHRDHPDRPSVFVLGNGGAT